MPLDPIYTEIGAKVRQARQRAGRTQQQLADYLGRRRTTVTNIEHGRQRPPLDLLLMIARFLEVEPLSLLPDAVAGHEGAVNVEESDPARPSDS